MKSKIALRTYLKKKDKKKKTYVGKKEDNIFNRVLVFDTETTIDEFQNLKFGSFLIAEEEIKFRGMFYSEDLKKSEKAMIKEYCNKNDFLIYAKNDFVENVFYKEVLERQTLCIGFNLPFDLARLGIHFSEGRYSHKGRFSIQLSENKLLPRIKIKHIDSTKSFISFGRNRLRFKGYFLDLKTLAYVFSDDKKISLKKAGEFFKCQYIKSETEEHGKINLEYIDYNVKDVLATYDLYLKLLEHHKMFGIKIPLTKIFSSASLGKYALNQLGIKPLSRINANLNAKIKGNIMSAYFGGRCEVKLRKTPVKVSVLDFLSMYPSLTMNMNLWNFVIAKDIKEKDVTKEINNFLQNICLKDLTKRDLWGGFNVLIELEPNEDILPIRSNYKENSNIYNVGINHLKYKGSLFYALPDIIGSVLLSRKVPKIKKAIRFIPYGKQDTLKPSKILGLNIDSNKDNLIKKIIEKRNKTKIKRDKFEQNSKQYKYFEGIQKSLKILANSVTYGIFIELQQSGKETDLEVYSNDQFFTRQKFEEEGKFFNPLIAVMQISGARLLLAMAETYFFERGETHYYMDTDSCFVPPHLSKQLSEFFSPLNPYSFDSDFFEIEQEELLFYGISSKRYVLYELENNKPKIKKYKLHGLGHLLNPYKKGVDWQKQIWEDVLNLHYENISQKEVLNKYQNLYAISKMTISTPFLYKRFKEYNKNKPLKKQIKPFNFILIGQSNNKEIKPISSFSHNSQSAVYKKFIDYNSCKTIKGIEYWKSLSDIFYEYVNHPEAKFENGDKSGLMKRRIIFNGEIVHIGKETRNLENQPLEIEQVTGYFDREKVKQKILAMTPEEAREKGIKHRSTLKRIKDKIRRGEKINWKCKEVKKLI